MCRTSAEVARFLLHFLFLPFFVFKTAQAVLGFLLCSPGTLFSSSASCLSYQSFYFIVGDCSFFLRENDSSFLMYTVYSLALGFIPSLEKSEVNEGRVWL